MSRNLLADTYESRPANVFRCKKYVKRETCIHEKALFINRVSFPRAFS